MFENLKEWQELVGSLVGAAIPIFVLLFSGWYKNHREHKRNLVQIEKFFVYNLNNILDAKRTIKRFISKNLSGLIKDIESRTLEHVYSADVVFLPMFNLTPINEEVVTSNLRSTYLVNITLQSVKLIRDFSSSVDDLRNQFNTVLSLQREMSFQKLNSPDVQNETYKDAVTGFKNILEENLLENLKICIEVLSSGIVVVQKIQKNGWILWRSRFSPSFKYFKTYKKLKEFKFETHKRIGSYLEKDVSEKIREYTALADVI